MFVNRCAVKSLPRADYAGRMLPVLYLYILTSHCSFSIVNDHVQTRTIQLSKFSINRFVDQLRITPGISINIVKGQS